MRRNIFIIKTLALGVILFFIARMIVGTSSTAKDNAAYIRVLDPYQSKADLQQSKNLLHGYLNTPSSQPIGLILWSDKPLFLLPPTYDTGTLRTYIDSIQSEERHPSTDFAPLVRWYHPDNVFVSSDQAHAYHDIQDFGSIDPSIISHSDTTSSYRKITILSILLICIVLI